MADGSITELVDEWARRTAALADRLSATATAKAHAFKVAEALHQAKAFVELIASGTHVTVTLRADGGRSR